MRNARLASAAVLGPSSYGLDPILPRDGETYDHAKDGKRLHKQHNRVLALMSDQQWRSLAAIASCTHDPEASISARLRDLRKPKFGGWTIERRRGGWGGTFEYRLVRQLGLPLDTASGSAKVVGSE